MIVDIHAHTDHLRAFGHGLEASLRAASLLQARLFVAGEYTQMWPRADAMIDHTMEVLNPSNGTSNVAVKMALLPAILNEGAGELICKPKVYCYVKPRSVGE
jgi:hypothetical protein